MNSVLPVAVIAAIGYFLFSKGYISIGASGAAGRNLASSTILGGGLIQSPTRVGDFPSDAYTSGADNSTTGWWQQRLRYANSITSMGSQYLEGNIGGISDMEQIEAREGVPGNTQLVKASYERLWASRLGKINLPLSEWLRLRGQYVSQYGGEDVNPPLTIVKPELATGNFTPETFLNAINDYRRTQSKPALQGLGCRQCGDTCGMGWLT